jgi:lipopolysaccharide transport system permease protein
MPSPPIETSIPVVRIQPTGGFLDLNLRELWDYRELLYFLIWRDVKVRYKQTVIGAAWAVIQPFMTMVVFTIFLGSLTKVPSDGLPYPVFFYSALLPWTYFAQALTSTTNSMLENQHLITRIYFPRMILPLTAALTGVVDFAIALSVLFLMLVWYGLMPSLAVLFIPFFFLLAVVTALGVGLWLAALNAMYRDVRYTLPFLVQLWMFASPVVYPSSLVPTQWQWLYGLNPMVGVISGFRWALTGTGQPPGMLFAASAVAMVAIFIGGFFYLRRMEEAIVDAV